MNQKLDADDEDVKAPRSRINESSSPHTHSNILGRNGMEVGELNMLHYFENTS